MEEIGLIGLFVGTTLASYSLDIPKAAILEYIKTSVTLPFFNTVRNLLIFSISEMGIQATSKLFCLDIPTLTSLHSIAPSLPLVPTPKQRINKFTHITIPCSRLNSKGKDLEIEEWYIEELNLQTTESFLRGITNKPLLNEERNIDGNMKALIVAEVLQGKLTTNEIGNKYNLDRGLIRNWCMAYHSTGMLRSSKYVTSKKASVALEQAIKELDKVNV